MTRLCLKVLKLCLEIGEEISVNNSVFISLLFSFNIHSAEVFFLSFDEGTTFRDLTHDFCNLEGLTHNVASNAGTFEVFTKRCLSEKFV